MTTVVLLEGEAVGTIPLVELRRAGTATGDAAIERRLAAVEPADVATIVYTSGTTGPPKRCVTTHGNLRTTAAMYERELELGERLTMYLYLPLRDVEAVNVRLRPRGADQALRRPRAGPQPGRGRADPDAEAEE